MADEHEATGAARQAGFNAPLLLVLTDAGLITPEQAADLQDEHEQTGRPVRNLLIDAEIVTEARLLQIIAEYLGTRVVSLQATDIPPDVVHSVPASIARMYNVVPISRGANTVELAVCDFVTPQVQDELMFALTCDVTFVLANEEDLHNYINQFYGDDSDAVNEMLSALEDEVDQLGDALNLADEDDKGLEEVAGSTPVIKLVNIVLLQAVQERASDIHFEPFEKIFRIRYRVDGALYEMQPPPRRLAMPMISRIKVMASLDIAEKRLPQDGRINISFGGRQVDLRVSTLPTQFGESVVLRVLDRSVVSLDLENLGMPDALYSDFMVDIMKPNGIICVTGPTGSGKTTTLYSALRKLNTIERKLLTAEQPVEYDIDGIIQVPINEQTGNTFAMVLRAFLRQDPDVMMVGEIRDLETAQIAIQASLTGHMVFSTLHTNDSAGAVTRLIDMDVEPYLISSTLVSVIGQRLVRKICENCKTPHPPDEESLAQLALTRDQVGDRVFSYGAGCAVCNETGYKGRRGIYEYLRVNDSIRDLINKRQPTLVIRNKACEMGMRTMREDGVRNILDGYTTVQEVIKYT